MKHLLIFLFIAALCASYLLGYTPLFIPAVYTILSFITFLAYARDKQAAKKGLWRISETTLHLLALLCGWPGAGIAQQVFRHKTIKTRFRIVFWITVIANCGVLAWLHTHQGAIYLNTFTFTLEELILNNMTNSSIRVVLLQLVSFYN